MYPKHSSHVSYFLVNSDCSVLVLNVLCTSPSQDSVSGWHTSFHPTSQSGVANLEVPCEGLTYSCSQIEELNVKCDSEGELLQCACASNATQCNGAREGPYLLSYVIIPLCINTPLFRPLSWWSFKCTVECSKQYYTEMKELMNSFAINCGTEVCSVEYPMLFRLISDFTWEAVWLTSNWSKGVEHESESSKWPRQ